MDEEDETTKVGVSTTTTPCPSLLVGTMVMIRVVEPVYETVRVVVARGPV